MHKALLGWLGGGVVCGGGSDVAVAVIGSSRLSSRSGGDIGGWLCRRDVRGWEWWVVLNNEILSMPMVDFILDRVKVIGDRVL